MRQEGWRWMIFMPRIGPYFSPASSKFPATVYPRYSGEINSPNTGVVDTMKRRARPQ